jgi:hypothetical protein
MKKGYFSQNDYETGSQSASIAPETTLQGIIGYRGDESLKESEKCLKRAFNDEIRKIQKFTCPHCRPNSEGYTLDAGEALLILKKLSGYDWNTIPFGKMDLCREFLEANHHRAYLIFNKKHHYELMQSSSVGSQEYRDWYNKHER